MSVDDEVLRLLAQVGHRGLVSVGDGYLSRDSDYTVAVVGHDPNWIDLELEWALDEVEAGLDHHDGWHWAREGTRQTWSVISADGITVDVVVENADEQQTFVEVTLCASTRRRSPLTTGRRIHLFK